MVINRTNILQLFPIKNVPVGLINLEREDCYYSSLFDPLIDENVNATCKDRDYIAGITRNSNTRLVVKEEEKKTRTFFFSS